MTNKEFVNKLLEVKKYQTAYAKGTFGQKATDSFINQKQKQYPSWYTTARVKSLKAMSDRTNGSNTIRIQSDGTIVNQQNGQIKYALQYDGHAVFNDVTINGYATTGQLNAVSASINNLSAIAITSNNIHSQSIYGSQISAGSITANKLNSDSFKSSRIDVATIACMNSFIIVGGRTYSQTYENGKYYLTAPYQ